MTIGLEGTVVTVTRPEALRKLETASASARAIFWMIADLFRPVPAAIAPAFCTKNISSVGGYLLMAVSEHGGDLPGLTYHTTASWNSGSESVRATNVRVGFEPIMSRKSSW